MIIALAQLNYHIGNFEQNVEKIIAKINEAKSQKVDLVVFSELAVCGYPPLDFLEFPHFINQCELAIQNIAKHCQNIAAIVGSPSINASLDGKNLYNSAYFLVDGKVESVHHKALLPNYDIFDEYRYFESSKTFDIIQYKGKKIALTICEDLWDIEDDKMYRIWPMEELKKTSPDLMINIAASPFSNIQIEERNKVLSWNAKNYGFPLFYVNQAGAQTEIIFDGGSKVINSNGETIGELQYFEEDFQIFDTENLPQPISKFDYEKYFFVEKALIKGIRDYFDKMNFHKAILGLSGGIDSALVLYLAVKALGKENVHAVLMPSQFSSEHSITDSLALVENLGNTHQILPIKNIFDAYVDELAETFEGTSFNIAEENLQSRSRGVLLMAISNKFGQILLNTSNKSELAVGYGTLYGDMCGGLSVIGDLYKTEVFELCRYINREKEIIPENIITKAPSAELRPNQKDSDSLPEYDVLDEILKLYIEERKSPKQLIDLGFNEQLVNRVLKLVNTNEYKRKQFAPILRVSKKAFGMGRRMPIVGKYLS